MMKNRIDQGCCVFENCEKRRKDRYRLVGFEFINYSISEIIISRLLNLYIYK